jgi:hypothetical protein
LAAAKAAWPTDWLGQAPYFDAPFDVGFSVGGFELGWLAPRQAAAARKRFGLFAATAVFGKTIGKTAAWPQATARATVRWPTPKAATTLSNSTKAAPSNVAPYQPRSIKTPNKIGEMAKPTSKPE